MPILAQLFVSRGSHLQQSVAVALQRLLVGGLVMEPFCLRGGILKERSADEISLPLHISLAMAEERKRERSTCQLHCYNER